MPTPKVMVDCSDTFGTLALPGEVSKFEKKELKRLRTKVRTTKQLRAELSSIVELLDSVSFDEDDSEIGNQMVERLRALAQMPPV